MTVGESQQTRPTMNAGTRHRLVTAGAVVLALLLVLLGHRVFVDDASELVDEATLSWNGKKTEACSYDAESERMTVLTRLRTTLSGSVEFTVRAGVWLEGTEWAQAPDGAQGQTDLVVSDGESVSEVPVSFPLSQEDHAAGWTTCWIGLDHDRAEPWD